MKKPTRQVATAAKSAPKRGWTERRRRKMQLRHLHQNPRLEHAAQAGAGGDAASLMLSAQKQPLDRLSICRIVPATRVFVASGE